MLQANVVVATKGRSRETFVLLDCLEQQHLAPQSIVVVGTESDDIAGLTEHRLVHQRVCEVMLSSRAGSSLQRNAGIERLETKGVLNEEAGFVVFFDDDFRPAPDWLDAAAGVLDKWDHLSGLTGWVLADGINGPGITEEQANAYLIGELEPQDHWSNTEENRPVDSAYGCNMAFRNSIVKKTRFDNDLPLYGWQEDRDYTGQALRTGPVVIARQCKGVHLGVKSGRVQSGVRFGYSQVANPLHILKRGNMTKKMTMKMVTRNLAANIVYTLLRRKSPDYAGRLRGNFRAVRDVLTRRCHPTRILDF